MTLAALMQSDVQDVFLGDNDEFEVDATYYPLNDTERSIRVIKVGGQQLKTGEVIEYPDERIHVMAERHATRGIDDPKVGDTLEIDGDTNDQKFAWTGAILHEDAYAWWLEFSRPKIDRLGSTRRR